ncbi:MAG TPA: sulfatase [Pirellulaceae bacterium]|nr:sulfatase [Pirellulaceae bacterium]
MKHASALAATLLLFCLASGSIAQDQPADRPNVIVLYADDLGYGDLGCYGHPTIRTPHLDRMAAEGMRFTSFYSAAEVCTPSRAALLTGRYPIRSGMASNNRRVLFPNSAGGIPASEITLAEALKERGYATACVGKWHLGHLPQYLPMKHGFDSYFGIPYSNDMDRVADNKLGRTIFLEPKMEYWNVPLMRNDEVIERPADQPTLTRRYTEEAAAFIEAHQDRPFFLYLPYTMPHVPLFASQSHAGQSPRGLYGDVVEEIDASVGRILETLRRAGLDKRTLVVFSSDNGPWLVFEQQGGSAGLLRDGKGSTWEGGVRVPGIFWWPGKVKAGAVTQDLGSTLDILPTAVTLAGGKLPADRTIDGVNLAPLLLGTGKRPRTSMLFYRGTELFAARLGPYKAHFQTQPGYGPGQRERHDPPLLYHLGEDPGEKSNVAARHPDVIAEVRALVVEHEKSVEPAANQLDPLIGKAGK